MKRIVTTLCILLVFVIFVGCTNGCSNQPKLTTADEIVQALKDAGFNDAHRGEHLSVNGYLYDTIVYLSSDDDIDADAEYIDFVPLSFVFDELDSSKHYVSSTEYYNYDFTIFNVDVNDYSKILDAVMPYFDLEYENNGSEIINQLLEYEKNIDLEYKWETAKNWPLVISNERNKYTVSYTLIPYSDGKHMISIDINAI